MRQAIEDPAISLVAVGKRNPNAHDIAQRLKVDSAHGRFQGHTARSVDGELWVDDELLPMIDTVALPDGGSHLWEGLSDSLVIADCTGAYTTTGKARLHLEAGANAVVLSSPPSEEEPDMPTLVRGVNDFEILDRVATERIVAVSSCTTNCTAPVIRVMTDAFGVESVYSVVAHARTMSQPHQDSSGLSETDRRSFESFVMANTGSAREIARLFPDLDFDTDCIRGPVEVGSVARVSFEIRGAVSQGDVLEVLEDAQGEDMKGVIALSEDEDDMFSRGIIGTNVSATIDAKTMKIKQNI